MSRRRIGETSYKETAFGIIPRSELILLEIEGIKRAWDFVLRERTSKIISVTPTFLKDLHREGFGWIFPEFGGKFRKIDVQVSQHEPPKSPLVAQLVHDFCLDLAERLRYLPEMIDDVSLSALIELLAWAHHRFLWIHPFQDYNGRLGRLLINIILLNLDLPPIELKVATTSGRKTYIKALHAADGGEYALLERMIRRALEESATTLTS